ncbi:FkbM family methyltransferase [Lysinibacillus sp. NPDC096212]|uniref:FkbM family methyltransferase n=1 Tax=Lysinibacillus sp. NPDC096212 TaxID=3364135 RepID=UPI0037F64C97
MFNKRLYVFGTGKYSEELTDKLISGKYVIDGYIDRHPEQKNFLNRLVFSLQEVLEIEDDIYIVVGSSFYEDISTSLSEQGLIEYKDYCSGEFFMTEYHSRTSYSQFGEDILIESVLEKIKFKGNGLFIDVGAYHPYKYSNTYALYKKGWKGINIEPTPYKIDLFNVFRPKDINLGIGISSTTSQKDFYIYDENAYNTTEEHVVQQRISQNNLNFREMKVLEFSPLSKIVEDYLPEIDIHLLTIDVEGHELEVLQSYSWEKHKPSIIAVEIFDLNNSEIKLFLEKLGYVFMAKTIATGIFVLEELL